MVRISKSVLLFSLFFCVDFTLHSQSMDTPFGKNRIQYHDNFAYWNKYESDHFIAYWYGRNRYLGQSVLQIAELDHDEVRKIIEHKINDKIELIIYTDLHDLKQSNIGIEDAFQNKSGETKIAGNKMFVYFDGNHQNLRRSIREGIASVYLGALMLGSNFQEILQSTVFMDLPEWFTAGLISFAGDYWNIQIEDELRDITNHDKKMWAFKKISEKHPRVAGHSFWNYISNQYGRTTIANVVYLTKISRDVKGSFEFVLNVPYSKLTNDWESFYKKIYVEEKGQFQKLSEDSQLSAKNRKSRIINNLEINNDQTLLAYTTNQQGKSQLFIKDLASDKDERVWKKGYKNKFQQPDLNMPVLAWHPTKDEISFINEEGKEIVLYKMDARTGVYQSQKLPLLVQRVYSISYVDEKHYLLTASMEGVSDIFIYNAEERTIANITSDYYDDLDARYTTVGGEKGILFSSNRPDDHILPAKLDTLLPLKNFDVFFYPMPKVLNDFEFRAASKLANRLTFTNGENERRPISLDNYISYTSGQSGIINTYITSIENQEVIPLTNLPHNAITYTISNDGSNMFYTLLSGEQYKLYKESVEITYGKKQFFTDQKKWINQQIEDYLNTEKPNKEKVINYTFQSKFKDPAGLVPLRNTDRKPILSQEVQSGMPDISDQKPLIFDNTQVTAAGLAFKFFNVTTRMDNEVLFEGLELFGGQNPQVNQVPMGFLAKASASDLLENYRLEGGVRIPTSLNGSEAFLTFDNNKNRLDRRIAIYRRTLTERPNENVFVPTSEPEPRSGKEQIVGFYQLKYPLSVYTSLRAIGSLRFDRNYQKSLVKESFESPIIREKRIGLRLEYVFDNTLDFDINVLHGTRMKVYAESFNQFELDFIDGFSFEASKGFTNVVGIDARHYIPVFKYGVLALRGASAFSFGNRPNLYYLGGTNNQVFNSFEEGTPTASRNFAFQANANHMRGFKSNIRNGTNFAIVNTELRLPIFKFFLGKNKGASFIRNFQIVGFADAGVAWYGLSPYSKDNPINKERVETSQITIDVNYYRDPLIASYGVGARTSLFGYYLRADYAYGIETRAVQSPKLHLALGFDF